MDTLFRIAGPNGRICPATVGGEKGAIVIMGAVILALLVGITAIVLNSSYRELVRSELQTAADTAALAGAGAFCSQGFCFDSARIYALEALRQQVIHGGPNADPKFELSLWDLWTLWSLSGTSTYDGPEFRIKVEVGWQVNNNFFPFSTAAAWNADHPGVPYQLAVNALRISLTRKNIDLAFSELWSSPVSISATATAVADAVEPICSAPFAVTACSLEDRYSWGAGGGYNPLLSARGERIFTRSDRYCGGADCDLHPSFPIEMRSCKRISDIYGNDYFGPPIASPIYCTPDAEGFILCGGCTLSLLADYFLDSFPYWNSPRFGQTSDSFGFVGLADQPANSSSVRAVLTAAGGCSNSHIGSTFNILPTGFDGIGSSVETEIWGQITGSNGDTAWTAHPALSAAPLPLPNGDSTMTIEENWYRNVMTDYYHAPMYSKFNSGVCNSRRFDEARAAAPSDLQAEVDYIKSTPVWVVNVPVIADADPAAQPCSTAAMVNDPLPDPTHQWIVIGYVRMVFDDVDIGRAPPDFATVTTQSLWFRGFDAPPVALSSYQSTPQAPSTTPMSFIQQCNLTRGRMIPDETLIPLTPNGIAPERMPSLVQ